MRTDILSTIWNRSPGKYIFLPAKNSETGEWYERSAIAKIVSGAPMQPRGLDLYFSPGTYLTAEGGRKEENHAALGVLYADLDDEFNRTYLKMVQPSLLTETSHGMYQAVWLLSEPLTVSAAGPLNKRLSHFLDADYGSWIITKVLRIPGSMNWKRGGQKVEVVEWDPALVYPPEYLDDMLPLLPQPSALSVDNPHPILPTSAQSKATINRLWPRIDHKTRGLLATYQPVDRSLFLARCAQRLAACNLTPDEIFIVLWNHPANKFKGRPDVLWSSVILSAFQC